MGLTRWIEQIGQGHLSRSSVARAANPAPPTTVLTSRYRPINQTIWVPPDANARNGLTAYEKNPFVHTVIDRVASKVAGQDYHLVRRTDATGKRIVKHAALSFLHSGSEVLDGYQSRKLLQMHLDLAGEAFLLIGYDSDGKPASYLPIPPNWVLQVAWREGETFKIMIPRLAVATEVPWRGMIWIKRPKPSDPIGRGFSATQALLTEISLHEELATFFYSFVKNRARPDIIITGTTEAPLSLEDAKTLDIRWRQQHGGPDNAGKHMVSSEPLEVHEVGATMQESQASEIRKMSRDFILEVYGVQPSVFGVIENANRATADAADYAMARDVVEPRLKSNAEALYQRLIIEFPDLVRFFLKFENPVAEDKEFQLNCIRAAPSGFKVDDVRVLAGLEPDPSKGDVYLMEGVGGTAGTGAADPNALADGNKDSNKKALRASKPLAIQRALTPEQIDQVVAGLDEDDDGNTNLLFMALRSAAINAAVDGARGRNVKMDDVMPSLESWAKDRAAELIDLLNETSADAIRMAVEAAGNERSAIAGAILAIFGLWARERARTVATTEANGAMSTAEIAIGASASLQSKVWVTQADERVRSIHRTMHGQIRAIGQPFTSGNGEEAQGPGLFASAENNVHCLLGDTPVTAIGAISKVYSRLHNGPVITIKTSDGLKLSGTPNHPVLTDRGWVGLGELVEGDNVVRCDIRRNPGRAPVLDPNNAPLIADILSLAIVSGRVQRIAGGAPQFHGDGGESEVDIVSLDGELRSHLESKLTKKNSKLSLAWTDPLAGSLRTDGDLSPVGFGLSLPANRSMSGFGNSGPFFGGREGHAIEHGLGSISRTHANAEQSSVDDASVDPVMLRQGLDASTVVVSTSKVVEIEADVVSHESPVKVFNLETNSGAYISSGIVVGNCRCGVVALGDQTLSAGDLAAQANRHDASLKIIEAITTPAIASLFQRQQQAVVAKLRSLP